MKVIEISFIESNGMLNYVNLAENPQNEPKRQG